MALDPNQESNSTNIYPGQERLPRSTPYSRSPEEIQSLLRNILDDPAYHYLDTSLDNPTGSLSVFRIDSRDPNADIGRTLEAQLFSQDAGYSNEFIEEKFSPYDPNSIFLLLVDRSTVNPQLVGALRTIDCSSGDSETISMFREFYGEDVSLPPEMSAGTDKGEKVWDIFSVVIKPEYRNGINSGWLYHALYKMSLENGINRWLSNVTPKEMRNLRDRLGIPFEDIPGIEPVVDIAPNSQRSEYGFYYAEVEKFWPAVMERIDSLEASLSSKETSEKQKRLNQLLIQIAKIAAYGSAYSSSKLAEVNPSASDLGYLQKIKDIYQTARYDFEKATLRGKVALGSLVLMTAIEWGPGNETITPLIGGQVLDLEKGVGGVVLTAGVTGGYTAGQQLAAGFLARKTAAEFPTVSEHLYQDLNPGSENEAFRFKSFNDLSRWRRFLYSLGFGSSFNILREVAVTGRIDQERLKKVNLESSAIAGGSVAVAGAGVEVVNQQFNNNEYVHFALEWGIKDPLFWLGVIGALLTKDYLKHRKTGQTIEANRTE